MPNPTEIIDSKSRFGPLPRDRIDIVSYSAANVCRTPLILLWQNFVVGINGKTFMSVFVAKLHVG